MKKKILILGGTMFTGRALVEKLIQLSGYDVTLFNRGKSNAGLFAEVKQINGNRETDDVLHITNHDWDCVIDFSGYYPLTFEKLLVALQGKVKRYIFISTISVFDLGKYSGRFITEKDETLSCSGEQKISKLPDAYGEKKAEMERLLLEQKNMEVIILRPSFIYGKYDWTDRFYYWLYRAKFSSKILMPQPFDLSLTYADDLVNGVLNAIEVKQHEKIYNTISQTGITLHQVVSTAAKILGRKVEFLNADSALLEKNEIDLSVFPLYVPQNLEIEGSNWLKDFSFAPVNFTETIEQTIRYCDSINWPKPKVGLQVEKESEITS